jgi:hypothetical protein
MALIINFAGASLTKPGSYSRTTVAEAGVATPAVGTVALIGEADAGLPFSEEKGLSSVSFGPDEFSIIKEKFGSGPLVDAAKLAISPSNDPQIVGGAQEIILLKTNQSTKASLDLAKGSGVYGSIADKKGGANGNSIAYQCSLSDGKATITLTSLEKGSSEVSAPLGGNALMTIQCTDPTASAATVSISATHLTVSVTGASGAQSFSAPLAQFASVNKLCEYISAQPGHTASPVSAAQGVKPVSRLDRVSAVNVLVAASVVQDAAEVRDFFAQSDLVDFTQTSFSGLPNSAAKTFLSGGSKGGTSPANILDCFDALMKRRVNFIVPLFSRDAAEDIEESLTDENSSYSIDAVHAAAKAHAAEASSIKGRKERQAWVGYKGTWEDTVEKAAVLNSARVSLCCQDVDALSADGSVKSMHPHMLAVIAAGMHASAPIGLSTTFKSPQINGFTHSEFDPEIQAEKAILGNISFVEKAPNGGFRFVLDNNTYASETNAWIYNRPSVIFAGDFAAYALRISTEQYVGQRNSDVSAESIKNLLVGVFDGLRQLGVIVPDRKTGGRGYKDLNVKLEGSIIRIDVTLALVENYEFVLSDLKVQRAG